MRVYLFGAGASFQAGYPLAKNLIEEIETEARNSPIANLSSAWAEWQKLRDTSSGVVANDETGISELLRRLEPADLVIIEATGGVEVPVARALATAGIAVA